MLHVATQLQVSKRIVLDRLQILPNWEKLQIEMRERKRLAKQKEYSGVCEYCHTPFTDVRRRRYCRTNCIKMAHKKRWSVETRAEFNRRRQQKRAMKEKKLSVRAQWIVKLRSKFESVHHRNLDATVQRALKRVDSVKNQMVSRSKKAGVECNITTEHIRQLLFDNYNTACHYCGRILVLNNSTFDHIIPISKGGPSTVDNIQVICRPCNHMKGSLHEESFLLLLAWLRTVPEELRKDISIRLARGIN